MKRTQFCWCSVKAWMRSRRVKLVVLVFAAVLPMPALAQQPHVFYAIGREEQSQGDNLYEVDAATLRVVKWVDASLMESGVLTANRDAIILAGGDTMMRFTAPGLVLQTEMTIGTDQGIMCLDSVFIDRTTGLAHFSCSFGKHPERVVVVDTLKKTVVAHLEGDSRLDRKESATSKGLAKILGSGDRVIQDWGVQRDLKSVVSLPNGNLVLETNNTFSGGNPPRLLLCDPASGKVLRTWTETQKYPFTETYSDNTSKEILKFAQLHDGPVLSRDGLRLFAMSEEDVILWDSSTLDELDRLDPPELAETIDGADSSFYPAPDGRGMWFFGKSGKIYSLDDHTGKVIEEVKLPFHIISLIREPE